MDDPGLNSLGFSLDSFTVFSWEKIFHHMDVLSGGRCVNGDAGPGLVASKTATGSPGGAMATYQFLQGLSRETQSLATLSE